MPYIPEQEYREMMFNFELLPHLKEQADELYEENKKLKDGFTKEEASKFLEENEELKELINKQKQVISNSKKNVTECFIKPLEEKNKRLKEENVMLFEKTKELGLMIINLANKEDEQEKLEEENKRLKEENEELKDTITKPRFDATKRYILNLRGRNKKLKEENEKLIKELELIYGGAHFTED